MSRLRVAIFRIKMAAGWCETRWIGSCLSLDNRFDWMAFLYLSRNISHYLTIYWHWSLHWFEIFKLQHGENVAELEPVASWRQRWERTQRRICPLSPPPNSQIRIRKNPMNEWFKSIQIRWIIQSFFQPRYGWKFGIDPEKMAGTQHPGHNIRRKSINRNQPRRRSIGIK